MDKRHIKFVNEKTVSSVNARNAELERKNRERSRESMGASAERGFWGSMMDSRHTPERRQFT